MDLLIEEGFILALSDITLFENLHGLGGSAHNKAFSLLKVYERKNVSSNILWLAAQLGGFYHDEKMDGIDMGDKIISATAILENGYVLTANHKDYPHPFFITERSMPIVYKIKMYSQTLDLALYKPNYEIILRRLKEKISNFRA